ncbi:MAG: ATP-binding protein [Candidatus Marinimicrobia bacterium]|nr:ATP-binding protein [Candidatus Neomarinimicrobiota bacterium]
MKRLLFKELVNWKNSNLRKPLLLQGARQVGKTFLITEFGKSEFKHYVYLNFEQTPHLKSLFADDLSPTQIIENIGLYKGEKIDPEETLIIFDEIQIAPQAITSLKYFYEQAPEYYVIAAGSLLGVSVGKTSSFPVGKVAFMTLYPMTFHEYLLAFDEELIANSILNIKEIISLPELLHSKLMKLFKLYLYLGGMPEVVQDFVNHGDIASVRRIQNEILEAYSRDFSKHTDKAQAVKTAELWSSIPAQLARENKKFKYGDVRKGGRTSSFEQTIQWLKGAGLVNVVYNISKPGLPLAGYANYSMFKIYLFDTGLLGAMLKINSEIIIKPTQIFAEYNGAFIENVITSELVAAGEKELFYWTSKSDAEVDYLVENRNAVYPIEVKSGSSRNLRSLRSYAEKYNPRLIIRLSPRNFIRDGQFLNIPLYAAFALRNIIGKQIDL